MTTKHDLARRAAISDRQASSIRTDLAYRIAFGHAELRVRGGSYVMEGPAGRHELDIRATDLRRLNAHWTSFATAEPNIAGVLPYNWEN